MRPTEDFWGIFWIGFHGGRKVKISPALQKFPARARKKILVKKEEEEEEYT